MFAGCFCFGPLSVRDPSGVCWVRVVWLSARDSRRHVVGCVVVSFRVGYLCID